MNLDVLKDYDILICNNKIKEYVVKNRQLLNIKIYTKWEFISNYLFSYNDEAIIYLMDKYDYCYDVANMYLSLLYYVNDNTSNKKINFLVDIKKELINNNLLIFNDLFKDYIKDKRIAIRLDIDKLLDSILKELDYDIININEEKYQHNVIEFNSMSEEVEYVAYKICELIDNGIKHSDICLTNVSDKYYHEINRIFSLYNLHVNIPNKMCLSSSKIGKIFLNSYDIESISEYEDTLEYNLIVNILNDSLKYHNDKRIILYKMNNTYLVSNRYDNGIDIFDYMDNYIEDKYVFMIGFNEGIIPKTILDTNYISDNLCKYTLLEESYIINERNKINTLDIINSIKNLTITYKLSDNNNIYYPSILCDNFIVIHDNINNYISYSKKYNQLKLSNYMDNYIKYGIYNDNFKILLNNYNNLYNSYDHKYNKIDKEWDKLRLSYSSLNMYNECAFKYYVNYVLKIDKFTESFAARIGSIVHLILKDSYNDNFNLEDSFNNIIKEYNFNFKELFYLMKYKNLLNDVITNIQEQNKYVSLDKYLLEKEIVTDINDKISFKGIIDKVLYKELDNKVVVSLIDYKTGSDNISLNYLKYGLNMQLPIYLYLSTKLGFNNINYAGFYLQKINDNNLNFKLEGYSNSDSNILSYFDNNYSNSLMIKSMKVKNDGNFYSNAKVISNDEIKNIISIVHDEIINKGNMIMNNEFMINPKVIDNDNIGCKYCKYKDICFVNNSDYEIIKGDTIDYE